MKMNKSLLLVIDVQNDFCPGGSLAVNEGDRIIPPLNKLSAYFRKESCLAAATQDWHPKGHVSFASSHNKSAGEFIDTDSVKTQMLWPDHCVQGTQGAAFHKDLELDNLSMIIRKGFRKDLDSYSAFFENDRKTPTGLEGWIKSLGIADVYIGGLAADYCVFFSAMDCKNAGFRTIVISDAVKGVGIPQGSVENAVKEMESKGIEFIPSFKILGRSLDGNRCG